jgi:antitoxin VapB
MYIPSGYTPEAPMIAKSKVFKSNRSQAVRIPKAVAFPEGVTEVEIVKVGNSLTITPIGKRWSDFFEHGPFATDDFLADREDRPPEDRDIF